MNVNLGGGATLTWGSSTFNPATLILNETTANATLTFQNPLDLGAATRNVRVNAATAVLSGVVSGAGGGGLIKDGSGTLLLSNVNSYTGATVINGGVLGVYNLALGGVGSGIGASGSAASNLLLGGGTLQYLGTGVTTDRLLSVGSAGGGLDASGAGNSAVTFANGGVLSFVGTGARSLLLTGTSSGANTLAAVIADADVGSPTSLLKSGPGTWYLTGSNHYNGDTTVTGGLLRALVISGTGNTTVLSGTLTVGSMQQQSLSVGAGGVVVLGGVAAGGSPDANVSPLLPADIAALPLAALLTTAGESGAAAISPLLPPPTATASQSAAVPEPAALTLLLAAAATLLALRRRAKNYSR